MPSLYSTTSFVQPSTFLWLEEKVLCKLLPIFYS
jgi:hypothetical protein